MFGEPVCAIHHSPHYRWIRKLCVDCLRRGYIDITITCVNTMRRNKCCCPLPFVRSLVSERTVFVVHAHEKFGSLTRKCVRQARIVAKFVYLAKNRTTIILNLIDFFDIRSHKCTRRTSSSIPLCVQRSPPPPATTKNTYSIYEFFLFFLFHWWLLLLIRHRWPCLPRFVLFVRHKLEYLIFFPLFFDVFDCCCCCLNNNT